MEFIKPTTIIVPKNFVKFLKELDEFANDTFTNDTGEDMISLLNDIETEETEHNEYIKFEYEE